MEAVKSSFSLIKKFFERLFPRPEDNLLAMFGYAVLITVLIVGATFMLGRWVEGAKNQLSEAKKYQGDTPPDTQS